MSKKIIISESQFNSLLEEAILEEDIKSILQKVKIGAIAASAAIAMICALPINDAKKAQMEVEVAEVAPQEEWKMIADDVIVTVYNAVRSQCNKDNLHTASMFRINPNNPGSHKIIAMERTFMAEFGLKYGDLVKIEGTHNGLQDGIYRIEDTMNKRFGDPKSKDYYPHKIDILVNNNIKYGGTMPNQKAKVYVLNDNSNEEQYRSAMAPQHKRTKQVKKIQENHENKA